MERYFVVFFTILLGFSAGIASADDCAPDCSEEVDGTYFPHPQNCSLHYECDGGESILIECPSGLEYNPTLNSCDFPAIAGCTSDPDYECSEGSGTETSPGPTDSQTVTSDPATQTSGRPGTTQSSVATPPPSNLTTSGPIDSTTSSSEDCLPACPEANIDMAHPQDCTKFIECSNYIPYVFTCPAGEHWNAVACYCDFPASANCNFDASSPCEASPPYCNE